MERASERKNPEGTEKQTVRKRKTIEVVKTEKEKERGVG